MSSNGSRTWAVRVACATLAIVAGACAAAAGPATPGPATPGPAAAVVEATPATLSGAIATPATVATGRCACLDHWTHLATVFVLADPALRDASRSQAFYDARDKYFQADEPLGTTITTCGLDIAYERVTPACGDALTDIQSAIEQAYVAVALADPKNGWGNADYVIAATVAATRKGNQWFSASRMAIGFCR